MPKTSKREDKRGHWPKGKPRNSPPKDWPRVRDKLAKLLVSPDRGPNPDEFVRSRLGLARWLKISDRQVRRWLSSEDMPSVQRVELIKKWMSHWG